MMTSTPRPSVNLTMSSTASVSAEQTTWSGLTIAAACSSRLRLS
jgi:hypothetical protein